MYQIRMYTEEQWLPILEHDTDRPMLFATEAEAAREIVMMAALSEYWASATLEIVPVGDEEYRCHGCGVHLYAVPQWGGGPLCRACWETEWHDGCATCLAIWQDAG